MKLALLQSEAKKKNENYLFFFSPTTFGNVMKKISKDKRYLKGILNKYKMTSFAGNPQSFLGKLVYV